MDRPHVNKNSVEPCSETRSEVSRTPLSDTRNNNESLTAESIVGLEPGHQGLDPSNARGVARINPPRDVGCNSDSRDVGNDIGSCEEHIKVEKLVSGVGNDSDPLDVGNGIVSGIEHTKFENCVSGVACNSDPLDVGDDIGSCIEQIKVNNLISDVGYNSNALDVGNDISSCIEQIMVDNLVSEAGYNSDALDVGNDISSSIEQVKVDNLVSDVGCHSDSLDVFDDISSRTEQNKVEGFLELEDDNSPCTVHATVSLKGRQCSQTTVERGEASRLSSYAVSKLLNILGNGVTSGVNGNVSLVSLPSLSALSELDEMSMDGIYHALKAGVLSELVIIRPELSYARPLL